MHVMTMWIIWFLMWQVRPTEQTVRDDDEARYVKGRTDAASKEHDVLVESTLLECIEAYDLKIHSPHTGVGALYDNTVE